MLIAHVPESFGPFGPRTIIEALLHPEALVLAWRDHKTQAYPTTLFGWLLLVTIVATSIYGLAMGLPFGVDAALERALTLPLAAGLAWLLALPTLYIVGSLAGMKLDLSTTLLIATLTVLYLALALLASVPIALFFAALVPSRGLLIAINLLTFIGVGACASDVLLRCLKRADPTATGIGGAWLVLLAALGPELFILFGIFDFHA